MSQVLTGLLFQVLNKWEGNVSIFIAPTFIISCAPNGPPEPKSVSTRVRRVRNHFGKHTFAFAHKPWAALRTCRYLL